MNTKQAPNKSKLSIHSGSSFNGYPVNCNYRLYRQYLESIDKVLKTATSAHIRNLIIRVDLHLPHYSADCDSPNYYQSKLISLFIESLKAIIKADQDKKKRRGQRTHSCPLRYIWVKEQVPGTVVPHYHMVLILNGDSYRGLGDYNNNQGNNMATRTIEAWRRVLNLEYQAAKNLIHFPKDTPYYYLNSSDPNYSDTYQSVFYRLSYFAKSETKNYGTGSRSFGCSRG